jgi:D-glycero-D-manno-heptose 1,7-bisphosphate phosphatase
VTPFLPIGQAVILVDGPAVSISLQDIGGAPFLAYPLRNAARAGVSELLVLASGPGTDGLAAFDGQSFGEARCRVLTAFEPLGPAGLLRHFSQELAGRFYLLHGDRYFDCDLNLLSPQPRESLAAAAQAGGLVQTGTYALSRDALTLADDGQGVEDGILPALAASGRLSVVAGQGYFIDMRKPGALEAARNDLPEALRRPAVFFDRDGVLNHDLGYTHRAEDLRLMDGAVETIRRCNRANRYVFVVTNQSGVARGLYTLEAVQAFHAAMQQQLRSAGAHIDGLYICPHHPEGTVEAYRRECECRKPGSGMFRQALQEWPVDVAASVMIGDRPSDMAAAAACGIRGFQFAGGNLERFCEQHGVI